MKRLQNNIFEFDAIRFNGENERDVLAFLEPYIQDYEIVQRKGSHTEITVWDVPPRIGSHTILKGGWVLIDAHGGFRVLDDQEIALGYCDAPNL